MTVNDLDNALLAIQHGRPSDTVANDLLEADVQKLLKYGLAGAAGLGALGIAHHIYQKGEDIKKDFLNMRRRNQEIYLNRAPRGSILVAFVQRRRGPSGVMPGIGFEITWNKIDSSTWKEVSSTEVMHFHSSDDLLNYIELIRANHQINEIWFHEKPTSFIKKVIAKLRPFKVSDAIKAKFRQHATQVGFPPTEAQKAAGIRKGIAVPEHAFTLREAWKNIKRKAPKEAQRFEAILKDYFLGGVIAAAGLKSKQLAQAIRIAFGMADPSTLILPKRRGRR